MGTRTRAYPADVAQGTLHLLDRVFDEFNRTRLPPRDSMHADVTWVPIRDDPDFEIRQGVDAVQEYLASWSDAFDDLRAQRLDTIPAGEKVLVWMRLSGRGRGSGLPIEMEQGILYTFRADRIARGEEFRDRTAAERALERE